MDDTVVLVRFLVRFLVAMPIVLFIALAGGFFYGLWRERPRTAYKFLAVAIPIGLFLALGGAFVTLHWPEGPTRSDAAGVLKVGFDLDDTLLLTSGLHTPYYKKVNGKFDYLRINNDTCIPRLGTLIPNVDAGIQVNAVGEQLVKEHLRLGNDVYIITARQPEGGDALKHCIKELFGIKAENVFFADPKTREIKRLGLHIYYGDSDHDVRDALAAGAQPMRILRSCFSIRRGEYNPGLFTEAIILSHALHEVVVLPAINSLIPSLDEALKKSTEHDLAAKDKKAIDEYIQQLKNLKATTPCPSPPSR